MSQQQQQFVHDLSGVESTASLYQASQGTPSLAPWQQQASEPPALYSGSALSYGDLVNGGTQSRVEDWANQAVAATLQQVRVTAGAQQFVSFDYRVRLS